MTGGQTQLSVAPGPPRLVRAAPGVRISIALATYNGARYLPELLHSLRTQRLPPFEVVVGDDGSQDETLAILRRFAAEAPFPVKVKLNEQRLGYADNFLEVAARSTGDVVAFCDQDDIWRPEKLERVSTAFLRSPHAVLVCHYATVVDGNASPVGRRFPRSRFAALYRPPELPLTQFPGFTISVRRSVLAAGAGRADNPEPRPRGLGHDGWLWIIAACVGDVVVLDEDLVWYRQHENIFGDLHVGWAERARRALAADAPTYDGQRMHWEQLASHHEQLTESWLAQGDSGWAAAAAARAGRFRLRASRAEARAAIYGERTRAGAVRRWVEMSRSIGWEQEIGDSRMSRWKDLAAAVSRRPKQPEDGRPTVSE